MSGSLYGGANKAYFRPYFVKKYCVIPCINLFSALDWPGRWLPYGDHHINLRAKVDCAGCLSAECPHQNLCMDRLSVDLVWQACQKLHSSLALTPSF
jgi:hypothetical protein